MILIGKVDSKKGRIRTTFDQVPDAPVSKFRISLYGGKKGLLVNNRDLCANKLHAIVELTGQNGKAYDTSPGVGKSCKGGWVPRFHRHSRGLAHWVGIAASIAGKTHLIGRCLYGFPAAKIGARGGPSHAISRWFLDGGPTTRDFWAYSLRDL